MPLNIDISLLLYKRTDNRWHCNSSSHSIYNDFLNVVSSCDCAWINWRNNEYNGWFRTMLYVVELECYKSTGIAL